MSANFRIVGAKEIAAGIARLPSDLQRAAESAVLRAGAKPVAKIAKSKAPVGDTGLLKKSIGYTVRKGQGVVSARIGPRNGFARSTTDESGKVTKVNPTNYSHLVELGTSRAPAKPFIRPAVDSAKGEAFDAMAKGYGVHLEKVVAKLRKKR
jgi:HK97 gp10 family phage protein